MISPLTSMHELLRSTADPDLEAVVREFEGLLLAEVMKSGSKPLFKDGLLDGGATGRMYREFFQQEVLRQASLARGLGLASAIREQLLRNQATEDPAESR